LIILLGHSKGGVGKSTLAVNLAVHLASQGVDVALVDTDRQGSTTAWASVRDEEEVQPRIPCLQKFGKVHRDLEDLDSRYGALVVDAGGRDSAELRTAMGVTDILLMPLQPSQADVWATEDVVEVLDRARDFNPEIRAVAVLNRCPTHPLVRETRETREYLEGGGIHLAESVVRDRLSFRRAFGEGKAVTELSPVDDKAVAELVSLFEEVLGAKEAEGYGI